MNTSRVFSFTDAVVVCNGEIGMTKVEFLALVQHNPFIVCADGGANRLRRWKIRPHIIIGDLDSLIPLTKRVFSDIETLHMPDQNTTDLEKVLEYLIDHRYSRAVVVGATGNQIDHTLANISIMLKFRGKIDLLFKDTEFDVFIVEGATTLTTVPGQRLSLMPIGLCSGITTVGLRYTLSDESMAFGVREGISNEATGEKVTVSVRDGSLLMMVKR
jgi:thiamine pyrophosphokinase